MLRKIFQHLRPAHRRGSAVLEAALVLPVVISLTFGCVEFGYFLYMKNTLQGAAREGARSAIVATANSEITTAVQNVMTAAGVASNNYTVLIESPKGTSVNVSGVATGTALYVSVTSQWSNIGVRPLGIIPANKPVVGVAVMRRE